MLYIVVMIRENGGGRPAEWEEEFKRAGWEKDGKSCIFNEASFNRGMWAMCLMDSPMYFNFIFYFSVPK